jgi:chromosome segregation ATPase
MNDRTLARNLALLATEVDSLEKALAQAKAELARETERQRQAQAEAAQLRQELRYARRRAQKAEQEFAKLASSRETEAHTARGNERELREQLEQTSAANARLREQVERKERERRALEANLHELMGNLRAAAHEAGRAAPASTRTDDEVTFVREPRNGDR